MGLGIHLTSTLTGTHTRDVASADTSANMHAVTIGSLASSAAGLKTAFLTRTGSYAGVYKVQTVSGSGDSTSLTVGDLPSSAGSSYGPVACPSPNQLMTSGAATGITADDLRMCGVTDDKIAWHAINLRSDKSSGAQARDSVGFRFGTVPYLGGATLAWEQFQARGVNFEVMGMSLSGVGMNSQSIVPGTEGASAGKTAGTYREYGVVFYCADRARTDLTSCAVADQRIFYVADPNPNAVFGFDASMSGTTTTTKTFTMTATMTTTATSTFASGQAGGAPRQILAWSCLGAVLLSA